MTENPFESPATDASPADGALDLVRRRTIGIEAVVRGAALLLYFQAFMLAVLAAAVAPFPDRQIDAFGLGSGAVACIAGGFGVRRFVPWGRAAGIAGGILSPALVMVCMRPPVFALALVSFTLPVAMLLGLRGVRHLFTADHARLRAATPYIVYRAPLPVWVAFFVLLVALIAMIAPMVL